MIEVNDRLLSWASEIDRGTILQAERTARLPIIYDHVALMPDAHVGIGATVGSVVPTESAIIPSCVGVDVGCGMTAIETTIRADQLPDSLDPFLSAIERVIPSGVGKGHEVTTREADSMFYCTIVDSPPATKILDDKRHKARVQFGTLGSGNHFFELCLDERGVVWLMLHSGSRGIGNTLAQNHIRKARELNTHPLEDPDLAWFVQGTPEFDAYIADMLWSQLYARKNREVMMANARNAFFHLIGLDYYGRIARTIDCHHNYSTKETHDGKEIWVTRKGAVRAQAGDYGLIPGSMGTGSFVVKGKGNALSWNSSPHGAGRRMSRGAAKKQFTAEDLAETMRGKTWLREKADRLIDEIPQSYKPIETVMDDSSDLVEVVHHLTQIVNYKGT